MINVSHQTPEASITWSLRCLFLLLALSSAAQVRDLGEIRTGSRITWDYPWATEPDVIAFRVYIGNTNDLPLKTNMQSLGTVSRHFPEATNVFSGLNGPWNFGVTALARVATTNLPAGSTNLIVQTNIVESDLSEVVVAHFRDGVPVPPTNLQLFTVVYLAATNSLPAAPYSGVAPFPIPMAMTPSRSEPEYKLSGR